ncbi:TPA: hypothetical protein ACKRMM_005970 [Pseudomonas aeruginosa]
MKLIDFEFDGKIKQIEIVKYESALEIGDNIHNLNFDYINVPHKNVPDLIHALIELYPDWDK